MADAAQSGILAPVPRAGRHLLSVLADLPQSVGAALSRLVLLWRWLRGDDTGDLVGLTGYEERRMAGLEDGMVDGLFSMSKPVTGGYSWCPPMRNGQLDLQAVGL